MKALCKTAPGRGAELIEVDMPQAGLSDLVVQIAATAICKSDLDVYEWTSSVAQGGYHLPFVMGHEYCGKVTQIGSEVAGFSIGDLVAGETHVPCGHCRACRTGKRHICDNGMRIVGRTQAGSFASFMRVPLVAAVKLKPGIRPDHGAVYEPLGVALHALQAGNVSGKIVAVFGCGTIGRMCVELAGLMGASTVVAVTSNASRIPDLLAHGADIAFDGRSVDAAEEIRRLTGGSDVSIETSGSMNLIEKALDSLAVGGQLVLLGTIEKPFILERFMHRVVYRELVITGIFGRLMYETWDVLDRLVSGGKFDPGRYIAERMPLSDFKKGFEQFGDFNGRVILLPEQ